MESYVVNPTNNSKNHAELEVSNPQVKTVSDIDILVILFLDAWQKRSRRTLDYNSYSNIGQILIRHTDTIYIFKMLARKCSLIIAHVYYPLYIFAQVKMAYTFV